MLTRYRMMRETIGLSQAEAADRVHGGVRLDTVKAWDSGKKPPPGGAIAELHELANRLGRAADELAQQILKEASRSSLPVRIGIPAGPDDAYDEGYPSQVLSSDSTPSHQAMMRTIGRAVLALPADVAVEFVLIGDADDVRTRLPERERVQ